MTLEELAAHVEIQQVLFRYCRGVDRGDEEMISSVYHDEAIDEHGSWIGKGRDFAMYLVPAMNSVPLIGQHHITNSLIELDGDIANVESYFMAFHPEKDDAEQPRHAFIAGRYMDRFEKRESKWLIQHRQVILDISHSLERVPDWSGAATFPRGGRQAKDITDGRFVHLSKR